MSSVVAWVGVDSRAPSSFYLASDSRISWSSPTIRWDLGRKTFAAINHADIFGYCGDVLFPSLVLGQLCSMADCGLLWRQTESCEDKHRKFCEMIDGAFATYPKTHKGEMTFLHAGREGNGLKARFRLWETRWVEKSGWNDRELAQPTDSALVLAVGSGKAVVEEWNQKWMKALDRTSRSVFSSFCDALASGGDKFTGGPPQLVGLYRDGPARSFGIIHDGARFFQGLPVPLSANVGAIEWRNRLFEICDGATMNRRDGAQRQPRPSKLIHP